jgi:hypothetical protein
MVATVFSYLTANRLRLGSGDSAKVLIVLGPEQNGSVQYLFFT